MPDKLPTINEFMDNNEDYGALPITEPIAPEDRKLAAIMMGMNAALTQMIIEGTIPSGELLHFMIHFQEFSNRLYEGEAITLRDVPQTLKVDSIGGKMFVDSANVALTTGVKNANNIRKALSEASEQYEKQVNRVVGDDKEDNKQTSLEQNNDKPTLH